MKEKLNTKKDKKTKAYQQEELPKINPFRGRIKLSPYAIQARYNTYVNMLQGVPEKKLAKPELHDKIKTK